MNQYSTYLPIKPVGINEGYCPNRGRIALTYKANSFKSSVRRLIYETYTTLGSCAEKLREGQILRFRMIIWVPPKKLKTKKGKISKTSSDWDGAIKFLQDAIFTVLAGFNKNLDDSQVCWAKCEKRPSPKNEHGITIWIGQTRE